MRVLELVELQPSLENLTQSEYELLLEDASEYLETKTIKGVSGKYLLKPGRYVGALNLGDLGVVIRPKLPLDRVMFLISYALDPKNWKDLRFDLGHDPDVLESIIPGFLHHTKAAIRQGLIHGYQQEEDALHSVRGRIRFHDQARKHFGLPIPIEVSYDDYTRDILENRLLKAALLTLTRLPRHSEKTRKSLTELSPLFADVGNVTYYPNNVPRPIFSRTNSHYAPAIQLATLVLENQTIELRRGSNPSSAFVLDMSRVFENFMVLALRDTLQISDKTLQHGNGLFLDVQRRVRIRPDISWWENGRCRFVGDIKYKVAEEDKVIESDFYQLLAYVIASDLDEGLLIYAGAKPKINRHHEIVNLGKKLHIISLDLSGNPDAILNEVSEVGNWILGHLR